MRNGTERSFGGIPRIRRNEEAMVRTKTSISEKSVWVVEAEGRRNGLRESGDVFGGQRSTTIYTGTYIPDYAIPE